MNRNPVSDALDAHQAFTAAEDKVRAAEANRDEARARLEDALAAAGWIREGAAVSPGIALYRHRRGSSTVEFREVIPTLEWEATQWEATQ
jgi:hypothetical protein